MCMSGFYIILHSTFPVVTIPLAVKKINFQFSLLQYESTLFHKSRIKNMYAQCKV